MPHLIILLKKAFADNFSPYSTFVIDDMGEIPPELIVCARALSIPGNEFERLVEKEELPKPKLDARTRDLLVEVLVRRRAEFRTSIEASSW